MSDLRTRIIDLMSEHCDFNKLRREGPGYRTQREYNAIVADVLIRELGLPPTWGTPSFDNGETPTSTRSAEKLGLTGGGE